MVLSIFFRQVEISFYRFGRLNPFLSANFFSELHPDSDAQFYSSAKLVFHLVRFLLRQGRVWSSSFLQVAKVSVVGKIFQDEFVINF